MSKLIKKITRVLSNFSHSETQENVFNLPVRGSIRDGIMYDDGYHLLQMWKQSQSDI